MWQDSWCAHSDEEGESLPSTQEDSFRYVSLVTQGRTFHHAGICGLYSEYGVWFGTHPQSAGVYG